MSDEKNMPDNTLKGKAAGFFERRWRMVKAAAKQAYEYLFDVKTYVIAGVMFGVVALLNNNTEIGSTVSSFFGQKGSTLLGLEKGAGVVDVAWRIGQFVALTTAIRTGIAMAKESYACNNCNVGEIGQTINNAIKQVSGPEVTKQQSHSQFELEHGYIPTPATPPMLPTSPGAAKPPNQPAR